jgi:orotidine-5'-phosphate decarboxylase
MSSPERKEVTVNVKDKLIVALDVASPAEARVLVAELRGLVGMFKIGSQLFTIAGPELVREIVGSGARVFLDLKFHDIPNTVAAAAQAVTRLGVSMFNVHAGGGTEMMSRAVESTAETAEREGIVRPHLIAVTVLTSVDKTTLSELGISSTPEEWVLRLARLAKESGLDGVVASPQEARAIRSQTTSGEANRPRFLIVTPGVRPANADRGDQKRVATPSAALLAGADYLVIGRPITGAQKPAAAAQTILAEMENA